MKSTAFAFLPAALLGLLLCQGGSLPAQTANEERPTSAQLERAQRTFLIYIQDGENEYLNATNRKAQNFRLWQNNVATAKIRLDVVFTLMDGNSKFSGHQAQIGNLKKFFFESSAVNRFTTNYLALRNRAYDLQNKLDPLVNQLDPATRNFINDTFQQIHGGADANAVQAMGGNLVDAVRTAEARNQVISGGSTPPPAAGSGGDSWQPTSNTTVNSFLSNPNNPAAADALRLALHTSDIDPMSAEDAQLAVNAAAQGDLGTLRKLLQKYPHDPVLQALLAGLLQKTGPDPLTSAEAQRMVQAWASGDPAAIASAVKDIAAAHPNSPFFKQGGSLNPDSNPINSSVNPNPADDPYNQAHPKITSSTGEVIDEREWLDDQGHIKHQIIRAKYTDFKGGQIDSEKLLDSNAQKGADGSVTINPTEVAGSKIEWSFTIKETSRNPAGEGFNVTFQLVNDGTPADAKFDVTGWEGPDGKKDTTDNQFTVTFPKRGKYEVKAYGQTGKYHSNFTITQPVSF
jgi:hypothetical protein